MVPDHVGLPPTTQSLPAELAEMILSPTLSYIASSTFSSSAASSTMTSSPVWNSTLSGEFRVAAENGQCRLLGPFAVFVQAALGVLALLSLVFKRWRERPQRPVKIWAFDASKQVVGSALLHVANLLMSMMSSGELKAKVVEYQANPCSFYLLNLAIDVSSQSWSHAVQANCVYVDNHRHTHSCCTPPVIYSRFFPYAVSKASRINSIRELRSPTQNYLVAEAMLDLLSRSVGNEGLRLCHLPTLSLDRTGRRLGFTMDRGQRDCAGILCHALLPSRDERDTVLHHR